MNGINKRAAGYGVALSVAALGAAMLAGCASYGTGAVRPGQTADEVIQSMGAPTARYTRADGTTRLEFARGPFGKHTYMIDLDRDQRVTAATQVLTENNFNALPIGISYQEVLQTIGTPSERMGIPRQRIDVWSYRFTSPFCQWFQVSIDVQDGRVKETGYGPDPMCPENRPRFFF
jgi:hypothetical protein